jgi:2-oxoisovalerate dehydrogenase E1 component
MPATPADYYGLLRTSIEDPNPVVFIENRLLYGFKGPKADREHRVPIGKAAIARPGGDLTIVSWSRMLHESLAAAEQLADQGIDAEVIDLRTICPLDLDAVLNSVQKTSRLLVAHEAVRDFGVGAEIAAAAADLRFWSLDAPVARIGAAPTPPPYAPSLERAWLPNSDRIRDAAIDLMRI